MWKTTKKNTLEVAKKTWKRIPHLMRWHQTPRKEYKKYAGKITLENLSKKL